MLRLTPANDTTRSATVQQGGVDVAADELKCCILLGDFEVTLGRAPTGLGSRCKLPASWIAVSASHAKVSRVENGQVWRSRMPRACRSGRVARVAVHLFCADNETARTLAGPQAKRGC